MRIPFSKRYRAFPELDRFSDTECEGFVQLAKAQYESAFVWIGLLRLFMGIVGWFVCLVLPEEVYWLVKDSRWGVLWWEAPDVAACFAAALVVLGAFGGGVALRNRWLKRAILVRLKEPNCAKCAYPLLGLDVVDGGIICPECGQRFDLAERGLTPEDLISKPEPSRNA